jgi:hypothetical protein
MLNIWTEYNTNSDIAKELNMTPVFGQNFRTSKEFGYHI